MGARQEPERPLRAGLYLRLSRDDEGTGESASISTQRDILRRYARQRGIAVAEEYVDDGYSGTNYDRPAFRRMIAAIEEGEINCVITKDLSRLGRNSARTAELLEEFFPRHRIRYISVADGFDSGAITHGSAIAAPFMLLLNECYARDISQKIRASLKAKMEKGDYISPFAPYGYRKDPKNKNHLLIDEEPAGVVRSIFRMAADGWRTSDIAKVLNERRVPTPAAYRRQRDPMPGSAARAGRPEWTSSMLCKLLRNGVYLGRTEHGKTTKLSFKSKETLTNPREDWIVVEGTHEPIVSRELFEQVGRRAAARRCSPGRGFRNIFSGIARCADCGRNMTTAPSRKKGGGCNLCCGGYKAHRAEACSNHFIGYDTLYRVVQEELRALLALTGGERERLLDALEQALRRQRNEERAQWTDLLREKERRLRGVKLLIKRSFELYALGRQSDEAYRQLSADYEAERAALERAVEALKERLEPAGSAGTERAGLSSLLDELQRAEALNVGLLRGLIDRIEVEQGHYTSVSGGKRLKKQTIRICYKFIGPAGETP